MGLAQSGGCLSDLQLPDATPGRQPHVHDAFQRNESNQRMMNRERRK
jgi:hypothetical protein